MMTSAFTLINLYISSEHGKAAMEKAALLPLPEERWPEDDWAPGFYPAENGESFVVVFTPHSGETHHPDDTPTSWTGEFCGEETVSFGLLNPSDTADLVAAYRVEGSEWKTLDMPETFYVDAENALQQMISVYMAIRDLTSDNAPAIPKPAESVGSKE